MKIVLNEAEKQVQEDLDFFDGIEDCAILNDDQTDEAIADVATAQSTAEEELYDDEDVDVGVDYSDDIPDNDMVGLDVDDIIAAEREVQLFPLEDDELIDTAIDGDDEDYDIDLTDED